MEQGQPATTEARPPTDAEPQEAEKPEELSDKRIASLKPPIDARSVIVWDRGPKAVRGLGVRVTEGTRENPGGIKAFVLNYRTQAGKQRRLTLGRFPGELKLSAARSWAANLRKQIALGADPLGERHELRAAPTMNELADRYLADHAETRKRPRSVYEDKSLLRQWIRPEVGNEKVRDVTTTNIEALHRKITRQGTPARANRVIGLLSVLFNCAARWHIRDDNPCRHVQKNPERRRSRYLSGEELTRLLKALAQHRNQDAANAVRLLLLTGARRNEVLGATWNQFDLTNGVWSKLASETKQKREHRVPLSAPARALIAEMRAGAESGEARARELEREAARDKQGWSRAAKQNAAKRARLVAASPYLFPGFAERASGNLGHIRRFWIDVAKRAGLEDIRLHDLRHSFASFLVSAGLSLPVIGALLGHSQPSTTNRYAHLMDDPLRQATERVGSIFKAAEGVASTSEIAEFPKGSRR